MLAAAYLKYRRCRLSCLPFVWHFFSLWHTHTHTHARARARVYDKKKKKKKDEHTAPNAQFDLTCWQWQAFFTDISGCGKGTMSNPLFYCRSTCWAACRSTSVWQWCVRPSVKINTPHQRWIERSVSDRQTGNVLSKAETSRKRRRRRNFPASISMPPKQPDSTVNLPPHTTNEI